jgi:hypothetical protein
MVLPLVIFSAFMSCIAFALGVLNFIEFRASQKSTHQIQYIPVDDKKLNEEIQGKIQFDPTEDEDELTSLSGRWTWMISAMKKLF